MDGQAQECGGRGEPSGTSSRRHRRLACQAVPLGSAHCGPVKSAPKVDARFAAPIKAPIEESPSVGYRTVAHLLVLTRTLGGECSS